MPMPMPAMNTVFSHSLTLILTCCAGSILNPLVSIASDSEEIGQLLHTQAGDVLSGFLVQRLTDQGTLLFLQFDDAIFDGVRHKDSVHFDWPGLPEAMCTVDCLL